MPLHISVSSLDDFMKCRRLYFWKRIKRYERRVFNVPFLVGRVVHVGMNLLLEKKQEPIKRMIEYFRKEKAQIRKTFTLTQKEEEQLNEQEYVTSGMLEAYRKKYGAIIRDAKLIASEVEGALQINDNVIFVIKLDNLIRIKLKKVMHELKTSKYITPDYIRMIQTNRQTTIYFRIYNLIFEKSPINEIMFDVIRKPSIRQKKNESYQGYLKRLEEWYNQPSDEMSVFHVERIKEHELLISEESVVNLIDKISKEMLASKQKEDYYENWDNCSSYYGDVCPYYELCHKGGETKENMVLYQIRKSYHVSKENVLTEG